MRMFAGGALIRWILTASLALPAACGPAAPTPAAPGPKTAPSASAPVAVVPPAEPVASLRTGELAPIEHREPASATVVARSVDEHFETLEVEVVLPLSAAFDWSERVGCRVALEHDGPHPYSFAAMPDNVAAVEGHGLGAATLWVRRPRDQEGRPIAGFVYTPQLGTDPGHKVPFAAAAVPAPAGKAKSDPKLVARWAEAFARHLREIGHGPWFEFAANRVESTFGTAKNKAKSGPLRIGRDNSEMARLMETTTGLLSVQEALQHDRPLFIAASKEKRGVPIDKLAPPRSAPHPWDELLRGAKPAPPEQLADAVPAEFWYVRAADVPKLFALADEVDTWGTPAANLFDRTLAERDLATRYETQLGIVRTAVSRIVGPEIVASVALTGSDPYLREGSDVTALFTVKNAALFEAALDGMLSTHAKTHGGVTKSTVDHGATRIAVATSPDGAIRQHRASLNGLTIVSNSVAAAKSVLDTIAGKRARLGDEKDFRYMLARDPNASNQVLAFFGDRFVAAAVGPRQKVLEARRQMAASELMVPGFAALLYGWVYGRSPASLDELLASKLLAKEELKHAGGAPIEWRPGEPARSTWGTPSALTPLLELPSPDTATESERSAYDRFSRTYETYWSRYIDPALLRLAIGGSNRETISADLRVLPLIEGSEYREIIELAGKARVTASPLLDGVRAVVGIGPTAKVRREVAGLANSVLGHRGFKLDFLGDWAMIGIADKPRLAGIAKKLRIHLPEAPEPEPTERVDEIEEAARIPAYAAIEVRSTTGATLAIAALRHMADEMLPEGLSWSDVGKEHGTTLFRVALDKPGGSKADDRQKGQAVTIFYALTDKAFLVTLDEGVLRTLVADMAEGRGPAARTASAPTDGSQLVFDVAGQRDGGLLTVVGWLLSAELARTSPHARVQAEALLRGDPARAGDPSAMRALSLAYFGAIPTPPNGGSYSLAPDGVRDPVLGSASSPRWPSLPVAGSMVDKVLGNVARFRSEIAFDTEGSGAKGGGGIESLHVRAAVDLRER